ncbi:LLM class flavin-dependent oxidoreductase [Streptomyces sp. NPDC059755]|uniref:LLM class flavin-dependent oxidoreductase n=1 Tax=Streptomyces sp. NPDC059755 TaxID=3346934 RepID=UPI003651303F
MAREPGTLDPFGQRGRLLDEHFDIWAKAWGASPISHESEHYAFQDVHFEPEAFRPTGPRLWFAGQRLGGPVLRRLVRYGHGFHPLGRPAPQDLRTLGAAMAAAGRDIADLEMIGGTRAVFPDDHSTADLGAALACIPEQLEQGFTTSASSPTSASTTRRPSARSAVIPQGSAASPHPAGPCARA